MMCNLNIGFILQGKKDRKNIGKNQIYFDLTSDEAFPPNESPKEPSFTPSKISDRGKKPFTNRQ